MNRHRNSTVLGQRIHKARIKRGWSTNELASRARVPQPSLVRIESGVRLDPGFSLIARLAMALEISLDFLASAGKSTVVQTSIGDLSVQQRLDHLEAFLRAHDVRNESFSTYSEPSALST